MSAAVGCVWKINDQATLEIEQQDSQTYQLTLRVADTVTSTLVNRGQLEAYTKLLRSFVAED